MKKENGSSLRQESEPFSLVWEHKVDDIDNKIF